MKERFIFVSLLALLLLPQGAGLALADDPGNPDTCRVACLDVTHPLSVVVVSVSVYNDEALGGLVIPLVFGHPPLDVVCDSISFGGTRLSDAWPEGMGSQIDNTNYKLVFYAIYLDTNLIAGDGVVANLYFTTGPNWDSTLCVHIDTVFYPPTTVLEFSSRSSGQALHPKFKKGCLASGSVLMTQLINPPTQVNLCAPDTFAFVWSKSGEDVSYTLQYAQDFTFTTGVMTIGGLTDTTYTVSLPRQTYYWHVKASNACGKEIPYQDQPFSFYVFQSGDATNDGVVDVADVVHVLNYLYKDGPDPNPFLSGDPSCDGLIDVSDLVYLINYLYKGGDPPCCL